MGIFDNFRKKYKKIVDTASYTVSSSRTPDGFLQVEMLDKTLPENHWNTTRLVIKGSNGQKDLLNNDVQKCLVSYYDSRDKKDIALPEMYSDILAGIDVDLLQNDPDYALCAMKNLLNIGRVHNYLHQGYKDNPEKPCGIYIGSLSPKGEKYFDLEIGRISHDSLVMQSKRAQKENRRLQKQDGIQYGKVVQKSANLSPKQQKDNFLLYNLSYSHTSDGYLQIVMYDKTKPHDYLHGPDTTRLIIRKNTGKKDSPNCDVYDCLVSHYSSDRLSRTISDWQREMDSNSEILAGINVDLLLNDSNYTVCFMRDLLNSDRISYNLKQGLIDNPKRPCGMYVGYIDPSTGQKHFNYKTGEASHNSPQMQSKRARLRAEQQKHNMKEYNTNKANIDELTEKDESLQKELDEEGR